MKHIAKGRFNTVTFVSHTRHYTHAVLVDIDKGTLIENAKRNRSHYELRGANYAKGQYEAAQAEYDKLRDQRAVLHTGGDAEAYKRFSDRLDAAKELARQLYWARKSASRIATIDKQIKALEKAGPKISCLVTRHSRLDLAQRSASNGKGSYVVEVEVQP